MGKSLSYVAQYDVLGIVGHRGEFFVGRGYLVTLETIDDHDTGVSCGDTCSIAEACQRRRLHFVAPDPDIVEVVEECLLLLVGVARIECTIEACLLFVEAVGGNGVSVDCGEAPTTLVECLRECSVEGRLVAMDLAECDHFIVGF